jgi:bisphosphoglycerate-dependent phosphoglycerate mutase
MSKVQTNLIQAQESLFSLLKEITDKSDEEIKNLSIKFFDQVQKKIV